MSTVLGIETSCDETGVAVWCNERGLLAEALYSQIDLHARYGGVVPELASRDHVRKLAPLVQQVLADAGLARTDAVAYTAGPGLAGALMVGASLSIGLAAAWGVPVIPLHHMEGHLLAPAMDGADVNDCVALLVSGGHTMLVHVKQLGDYTVLGQTRDDAVGEAFDKTAKLLGLPYPGGPAVARLAASGDPVRFQLPRPMTAKPGLDFSFSGLKTAVYLLTQEHPDAPDADIARAFEDAVVDTLTIKCERALAQTGARKLLIAGGVAANVALRARLGALNGIELLTPDPKLCTDNGAMIAYLGAQRLADGRIASDAWVTPRWNLEALAPPGAG